MSQTPEAKKSLGQNFLHDPNIIWKINHAIDPKEGEAIIEIGPGPGAITRGLLEAGAHVIAIEKDPRMQEGLEAIAAESKGTLEFVLTDALEVDFNEICKPYESVKLVGNLPYNVGTQIVFNALMERHNFKDCVFMLQKEVIDRICALPGGKHWGRLGVWCDLFSTRKKLFNVPPTAFKPKPKVVSSIVRLTPLDKPRFDIDIKKFDVLLRHAFGQRRKMLRASLKPIIAEDKIESIGIKPTARPETLELSDFAKLSDLI